MKTYVIALERSKERATYIRQHVQNLRLDYHWIEAVDGLMLSEDDIRKFCDVEKVKQLRWWLNNGAIGCALSHLRAYESIARSGDRCGFVIEDDVILPPTINGLLDHLEQEIEEEEVILLYFATNAPNGALLSSIGSMKIDNHFLVYPMSPNDPITASAYVIGKVAARKMAESVIPIQVAADSWGHYFNKKCFSSMRLLFPMTVRIKNFKSSIDYVNKMSLVGRISNWINDFRIPVLYQLLKYRRKILAEKMSSKFKLVADPSPLMK